MEPSVVIVDIVIVWKQQKQAVQLDVAQHSQYDFLLTQTSWLKNGVTHSFHSVLIKVSAIFDHELGVVERPLIFRPEVPPWAGVLVAVEGHELMKKFRGVTEKHPNSPCLALFCRMGADPKLSRRPNFSCSCPVFL